LAKYTGAIIISIAKLQVHRSAGLSWVFQFCKKWKVQNRGGSRGGDWGDRSPKTTKVTLLTMISYNSKNSIRNIRPFFRPLFCQSSVVKNTSSILQ